MSAESFRSVFVEFAHSLDGNVITQSIHETLLENFDGSEAETIKSLKSYVTWKKLQDYSPVWLNLQRYASELSKLSSSALWKKLLNEADEKNPGVSNRLHQALIHSNPYGFVIYDRDLGEIISDQNNRFYGLSTVYLGLSATHGPRLASCTKNPIDEVKFQEITQPIFKAGQIVGSQYVTPPSNASELTDRLINIFSLDQQEHSNGYNALIFSNAFRGCPGVKLTENLFEGYKVLLQNSLYKDYFEASITN